MGVSKQTVEAAYQRHAGSYDIAIKLYRVIGLNLDEYRLRAVELLRLSPGDVVVDLGCGTGLNFGPAIDRIGPRGRLIGVDFSSEMLERARKRIERAGWSNVRLVHSDIAAYDFPERVDAVIATGVFGYVRERDQVVKAVSRALVPGGRVAIVNGKRPDAWPSWLFKLFVLILRPLGITEEYFDSRTWESVERYFRDSTFEEHYGGMVYICSGTAAERRG